MPFGLSTLDRIAKVTGRDRKELEPMLAALCDKGLVVDVRLGDRYHYMPAPFVIGIFEFTMMRMHSSDPDIGKVSRLFVDYLESGEFYAANFKDGQQVSSRGRCRISSISAITWRSSTTRRSSGSSTTPAPSRCPTARAGTRSTTPAARSCKVPLETCTSFGSAADYLVRHGMGREISKSEMKDVVQRSKELKLVFSVDNVRNQPAFLCHCCGCCCGILEGINKHGYPNAIVSSTLVPHVNMEDCNGCQKCARACHVSAITLVPEPKKASSKRMFMPQIDETACIGCGVCSLVCEPDAIEMHKREQHVIHPETTFERVILQCLERGTLQNQLFDDPGRLTHKAMRGIVGGFLRLPPVKRALMSDTLRSRFLSAMAAGAARTSQADAVEA